MNTVTLGAEHLHTPTQTEPKLTKSLVSQELKQLSSKEDPTLDEKIVDFKERVINYALNFMASDARYADVKEVKDVVGMVAAIEPKQQSQSAVNVNVLVQNLQERFKDDV